MQLPSFARNQPSRRSVRQFRNYTRFGYIVSYLYVIAVNVGFNHSE